MPSRTLPTLALLLLTSQFAQAQAVVTRQSGSSQIDIGGVTQVRSDDAKTDSRVSVFAITGTPTTPEARTAARSSGNEIAVNARIDDKQQFSGTDFSLVLSQAVYTIEVAPSPFLTRAAIDFVLPTSFLEVTGNLELPTAALEVLYFADLRTAFAPSVGIGDSRFFIQSELEASHSDFDWSVIANGEPGLDLTPLQNPTITDTGTSAFLRTVTLDFPFFQGHLDLGIVPAGSPLTIEYTMQARASGRSFATVGLAAINDPFLLETDPVQQTPPVTVTITPAAVPEPAATLLLACAGAASFATGLVRRRRRRLENPTV